MSNPIASRALAQPAGTDPDAERLRRASHQLEGVFFAQVFAAMRATVDADSLLGTEPGRDVFQSMLTDSFADAAASTRSRRGLGEALFRQLSRHAGLPGATEQP